MIAIRNNIKYRRAQISEVCGGKVKVGGESESLILILCYRPPNIGFITICEWEKFFSQFQGKVFWWRFNSHNIVWGSANTCRTGGN